MYVKCNEKLSQLHCHEHWTCVKRATRRQIPNLSSSSHLLDLFFDHYSFYKELFAYKHALEMSCDWLTFSLNTGNVREGEECFKQFFCLLFLYNQSITSL